MTGLTIRQDHLCSDPHWQTVLARVGKPFAALTPAGKIAAIDAVNRRRALTDEESDVLCRLVANLHEWKRQGERRKGARGEAAQ